MGERGRFALIEPLPMPAAARGRDRRRKPVAAPRMKYPG